ncbi:hypothetical protein KKH13_03155, partial [Patescibacteria group bacterium]|nr:hypothetical protein [Patescibacteria group bacterium]
MLRFPIPGVIAVGVVLVVGILVLKPVAMPPVGVATPPPQPRADRPLVEDNDALAALQATISSLLKRLEILEADKNIPSPAESQPEADRSVVEAQTVTKAVFPTQVLYLGAGSTTERNWTETGAQVQLNSANYPAGVNVVFEAGLSIIGGEVWARLKNKTTGAIISISEVSHNNSTVAWKGSGAFKLHPGNNLYVVELKSSSGETAN